MNQFRTLCNQALDILKEMEKENPEIDFSTFTYADGRLLASTLKEDVDRDLMACAKTAAFYISATLANHLRRGEIKKVLISGKDGNILIQGIGNLGVLTTVFNKYSSIKKIMNIVKKYQGNLENIERSYKELLNRYYQECEVVPIATDETSITV